MFAKQGEQPLIRDADDGVGLRAQFGQAGFGVALPPAAFDISFPEGTTSIY